jgi:hypothetical protein
MLKRITVIALLLLGSGLAGTAWAQTGKAKAGTTKVKAETAKVEPPRPLYGPNGVSPQAVLQGSLGSCYFHASIAALAKVTPETLRGAISPNPGGGYRVHFFSGPDEVVFPEDVEFGRAHGYDRSEGTWVGVLMRAYAQRALRQSLVGAIQKSDFIPAFTKPVALSLLDKSDLPLVAYDRAVRSVVQQDGVLDKASAQTKLAAQLSALGVPASEAQMLGGFLDEEGFFDTVALDRGAERRGLRGLQEPGAGGRSGLGLRGLPGQRRGSHGGRQEADHWTTAAVACGPDGHCGADLGYPVRRRVQQGQLVGSGSHAYTVMDFDEDAQTVTLRNPWGTKPDPDGVFTLPLAVFLDCVRVLHLRANASAVGDFRSDCKAGSVVSHPSRKNKRAARVGHPACFPGCVSVVGPTVGFAGRHARAVQAFLRASVAGIAGQHGAELSLRIGILAATKVLPGLVDLP